MELDPSQVQTKLEDYGFSITKTEHADKVHPGLNKAPQSYSLIYCENEETRATELVAMKWTLQPSWAKEPPKYSTFNTRFESLRPLKSTWRCAAHRRGILAMQGYYEWDQQNHMPYYIHGSSALLFCLVIWDTNPKLCEDPTFSIVTSSAAPRLAAIHERMPVIVDTVEEAVRWTAGKWPDVLDIVHSNDKLDFFRVGKAINKVGVERKDLNSPAKEPKTLADFFGKPSGKRKTDASAAHSKKVKTNEEETGNNEKTGKYEKETGKHEKEVKRETKKIVNEENSENQNKLN